MEWHRTLSEYGLSSEHEDPDTEMLNKIVEKVIIKKIKGYLETLNARSSRQMRYASQVMEQVSYYVDPNEKAYKVCNCFSMCMYFFLMIEMIGSRH